MDRPQLTRGQKALAATVVTGTGVIAMIGFVGSYAAVRDLADREGFGWFSWVFPVGVDVGITVMIALDLLLTWLRIPLPLIRYIAWLFTAATVVFNAATAWPNPLATGMHAVVPLMFIAGVEAARWSIGKLAEIVADTYMERTRFGRWILAPVATFRLWRRRILWELRSNSEAIEMERRRLVFRARLRHAYGRRWRSKAPVELVLLLKLANLGEQLPKFRLDLTDPQAQTFLHGARPGPAAAAALEERRDDETVDATPQAVQLPAPRPEATPTPVPAEAAEQQPLATSAPEIEQPHDAPEQPLPDPSTDLADPGSDQAPLPETDTAPSAAAPPVSAAPMLGLPPRPDEPLPQLAPTATRYFEGFVEYTTEKGAFPDGDQLSEWLAQRGITGRGGAPLSGGGLRRYLPDFRKLYYAQHYGWQPQEPAVAEPELELEADQAGIHAASFE